MKKSKISFNFKHGTVDGVYLPSLVKNAPLVIITNGHNGFYNYGMFPYIQEKLAENGISSYSYNFSHGGVVGDSDYFERLDLYEKNCMRLETEDLCEVVHHLQEKNIEIPEKLFLLSHSLGNIPTIFGARKLLAEGYKISGIILIAPTKTLAFWSDKEMKEWEENGVLMLKNNRTKQELPQGKEFLEETKQAGNTWNVEKALNEVNASFLIVHGEKDEAIPVDESKTIDEWNKKNNNHSELVIVPNATHTFNTKHPFTEASPELDSMVKIISNWILK